ncbi:DUF416 family protein [Oscillatoria amoena NRMC-F 0135]|nr:DUF416 family protein [Geitlerinema splendidum]MDL5044839.1 DUF416 family protein [Oscillatoria amoena NRMC-F 0135]
MPLHLSFEYEKRAELVKELEIISPLHRLAFAASICERMLPNYSALARETKSDPFVLRKALDEVWQILQGKAVDAKIINRLIDECECARPEEGDPWFYLYEGSMAVVTTCYVLDACLDPTPQSIARVAERAGDILFESIFSEKLDADPNWGKNLSYAEQKKEIATHPFVVRERVKQNEDFQRLKEIEPLDRDFLEWLRTSFDNAGRSLIDLS